MKRIMAVLIVLMVMGMAGGAGAREYTLNVAGPTVASGDSVFVISSPVQYGRSGVTLIDKPYTQGTEWSMQADFSSVSPYTIGLGDINSSATYYVTMYYSNFKSGGSPYVFPVTALSGNSTYAIPFTVPTVKYMWATLTSGVSAFWNFPIKLFSPGN